MLTSITTRIPLPSDHREKKSLCLPTSQIPGSDSDARVIVNGAQSRSKLRRISKAKSSIRSCIGHEYVYVYELGYRIVALKSWYPYFRSDTPTFMNETTAESPRRVHSSRPILNYPILSYPVSEMVRLQLVLKIAMWAIPVLGLDRTK